MGKIISFKAPEKCCFCPALRNNEYGEFTCFLTGENLSAHNVDVSYEIGDSCPQEDDRNRGE